MRAARVGVYLDVLEVAVECESDNRGMLGLEDRVPAGLTAIRVRVNIGADGVDRALLRDLVGWGDAHSVVACTLRDAPPMPVDIRVV